MSVDHLRHMEAHSADAHPSLGEDLPTAIPLPTTPTSMLNDREAIINESHMELLLEHLIAHPFPSDITREELQQESRVSRFAWPSQPLLIKSLFRRCLRT